MYGNSIEKEKLSGLYDAIDLLRAAKCKLGLSLGLKVDKGA
ncbi:MAG: hypothetical protein ACJA2D_000648 [Pseudohongiellaceae bacterium]|jgi:hypothetical protein